MHKEANEFKTYHPIIGFTYFFIVIAFAMVLMHPLCLAITLLCSVIYCGMLKKNTITAVFVIVLASGLFNPLFNHRGVTILAYFPSGNPLTLETILYGIGAGAMLAAVICWFMCFNKIMTSDKIIYLFGRIIPSLSLVFSMVLRFVPLFSQQLKKISNAQRCVEADDYYKKSIIKRAKKGMSVLSVLVTWALENSIDTADSMRGRGYGLPGRTAFSIFRFEKRDCILLFIIILLGVYVFWGYCNGSLSFIYYPYVSCAKISMYSISVFISYLCLCVLPIIVEIMEEFRWKYLISKI